MLSDNLKKIRKLGISAVYYGGREPFARVILFLHSIGVHRMTDRLQWLLDNTRPPLYASSNSNPWVSLKFPCSIYIRKIKPTIALRSDIFLGSLVKWRNLWRGLRVRLQKHHKNSPLLELINRRRFRDLCFLWFIINIPTFALNVNLGLLPCLIELTRKLLPDNQDDACQRSKREPVDGGSTERTNVVTNNAN